MSFQNRCIKDFVAHQRTSCFYFDLREIENRARQLTRLGDAQVRFLFPVKSFPCQEIIQIMAQTHAGFDVSNRHEFELVRPHIKAGDVLWSSSPVPWDFEFPGALVDGAHVGAAWGDSARRSLRVSYHAKNSTFVSRFGIDVSAVTAEALALANVTALHFHQGQEPIQRESWIAAVERIAALARASRGITHVNLGGGFSGLDWNEVEELVRFVRQRFAGTVVCFEPGRWLCGDAGKLIGKIAEATCSAGKAVVTTTLSRDCHLRWQQERFSISLHPMHQAEPLRCSDILIAGATCHEGDVIGHLSSGEWQIAKEDLVAVSGVSGYSLSWNHSFNGIPVAEVQFIK